MVDLHGQYLKIKEEVDAAINRVVDSTRFIRGEEVTAFENELSDYTRSAYTISCANGTDALILALLALDLQPGDEVITVPFTFVSTVEAIAFLHLTPIFVDVRPDTFNMDVTQIESAITHKTKAILPVHLFGQCADMEAIMSIARQHGLYVVEDACQSIGAEVRFSDGSLHQAGTMGDIGCTSFFPSKNLSCFGDGGALFTQNATLAEKIRMLANHGSSTRYVHETIGLNSRLDAVQAAILRVKLKCLKRYTQARQNAARYYSEQLSDQNQLILPVTAAFSSHVYHQYTVKLKDVDRTGLQSQLLENDIPSMVYYPCPIHLQKGYQFLHNKMGDFPVSESLSKMVLSLPMHTELTLEQMDYIVKTLKKLLKH